MKKTAKVLLVGLLLVASAAIAEKCYEIPPLSSGPTPHGKICLRTREGYCLWEETGEDWVLLGRYCLDIRADCKNHYPSAGPCNHLLDLRGYAKIYKCKASDGRDCSGVTFYYVTQYSVSPTELDCQRHRCRGKDSFIDVVPVETVTDDAIAL